MTPVAAFGAELAILQEVPADDLAGIGGTALTEAISRLRRGEVSKDAGYDGEYGRVRLFRPGELDHAEAVCDVPASAPVTRKPAPPATGTGARVSFQACRGGPGTGRKCNSIRVFPSVFGFTQSRPRNSATPSS